MPLPAEQIARLVDRHAVPLRLWVGRQCAAPEDTVQEAFCRLAVVDPPPDHPVAWLYRVAHNLAQTQRLSDRRRRAREQQAAACEPYDADPAARLCEDEAVRAVWQLDDALREVVVARIWGQLTLEEIGVLCGTSTATASRRYRDALEQIRRRLGVPCLKPTL